MPPSAMMPSAASISAGYTLVGTVEEANEDDVRALFDTNYFGQLRVIQAALPLLRQQRSGHILGVSSSLGIAAMPLIGNHGKATRTLR